MQTILRRRDVSLSPSVSLCPALTWFGTSAAQRFFPLEGLRPRAPVSLQKTSAPSWLRPCSKRQPEPRQVRGPDATSAAQRFSEAKPAPEMELQRFRPCRIPRRQPGYPGTGSAWNRPRKARRRSNHGFCKEWRPQGPPVREKQPAAARLSAFTIAVCLIELLDVPNFLESFGTRAQAASGHG